MSFNILYSNKKFSLNKRSNLSFILADILYSLISPRGLGFDYTKADKQTLKAFFNFFEKATSFVKKEGEGVLYRISFSIEDLSHILLSSQDFFNYDLPETKRDALRETYFAIKKDIENFQQKNPLPCSFKESPCFLPKNFEETYRGVFFEEKRFYFEFFISPKICEKISSLSYSVMREVDLWNILSFWQKSCFFKKLKAYSPLCQILDNIKGSKPTCLNEDNLCLSDLGEIYYIPSKVNKVDWYDNEFRVSSPLGFTKFTFNDDISDRIILTDWKNNILSYTQGQGDLEILDLSNFRKLTPAHVKNIFERVEVNPDFLLSLDLFIKNVCPDAFNIDIDYEEVFGWACLGDKKEKLFNHFKLLRQNKNNYGHGFVEDAMFCIEVYTPSLKERFWKFGKVFSLKEINEANPLLKYYFPIFRKFIKIIEEDYTRLEISYYIPRVLRMYGLIKAIVKYNSLSSNLNELVEQERKHALNQNIEKDWKVPSIPLISDSIGLLPHQRKILNIMKENPKYAIFPVSAGGGKSLLAILDILTNLKQNKSFPYLIISPTHLVGQYVKEVVYFTHGKLNVIPLTTSVVQTQELDRLRDVISQAPINTVVIASYDVLKYRAQVCGYGNYEINIFPIQEFLKSFSFQYCLLDESQTIKNFTSLRSKAVRGLVTSIPKVRLASGTMAHNTIADLVSQIGILDPSIFGSLKDFTSIYQLPKGGWKIGTEALVMKSISRNIVVGKALRKEWAALLPPKYEKIHVVSLTEKQQELYRVLLGEVLEEIQSNKALMQKLRQYKESTEENLSEVEETGDEDTLASMLAVYLQKLEIFTAAPYETNIGKILQGEDRISPKVRKVLDIVKDHIEEDIPGKIIIYCQNIAVAEAIYKASKLPEYNLQESGILYKAAEKYIHIDKFEKEDSKKWMVGVETSMNTGLNLQMASRLIRIQYTWTPGSLEQGNSRINRPQLKKSEERANIYFDWIVASRTVDICKMARLVAKLISVSKFDNSHNQDYLNLPNLAPIPMTLEHIRKEMEQEYLTPYMEAYSSYNKLINREYKEYRKKHPSELDEFGNIKLTPVPVNDNISNCFYIETPFVENMDIYKAEELRLVRADEEENLLENQAVYTEFGCGLIKKINKGGIQVDLGFKTMSFSPNKIFTSHTTNTSFLRKEIEKRIGLPYKPILRKRKIVEKKANSFILKPFILNNRFFLEYPCSGYYENKMVLQNLGFNYLDVGYVCPFNAQNIKILMAELKTPLYQEIFNVENIRKLLPSWKALYKISKESFSQKTIDSIQKYPYFKESKKLDIQVVLINKKYYFQIISEGINKKFLKTTTLPFKPAIKLLIKNFEKVEDVKSFLKIHSLSAVEYEEYQNFMFSNPEV